MEIPPHPEFLPIEKVFIRQKDSWYVIQAIPKTKITYKMPWEVRQLVGGVQIFYWTKLLSKAEEKDTPEFPSLRTVSFRILAWERWMESEEVWIKFCQNTRRKDAPQILTVVRGGVKTK
jgi:hypothetical protein